MICKKTVKNSFRQSFDKSYTNEAVIQKEMAKELVDKISEFAKSFSSAFELGCGTGVLTSELLSKLSIEKLFLNDLTDTSEFIENLPESTDFFIGDAETINYPKNLDLVTSNAAVQWFQSLEDHFEKVHSSLNKGGIFAFTTFGPENMLEIKALTGTGLNYPSAEKLKEMLSSKFKIEFFEESTKTINFSSAKEVLLHLRKTGVNAIEKQAWTKSKFQEFCKNYQIQFTENGELCLTYNPIIIIASKI